MLNTKTVLLSVGLLLSLATPLRADVARALETQILPG